MAARVFLDQGLEELLPRRVVRGQPISLSVLRRPSVKDLLEALGIPHPEIGLLLINGRAVSFAPVVEEGDRVEAFGLRPPVDLLADSPLRTGLDAVRFAVDINVGKLASLLRMAGLDAFHEPGMEDVGLAEVAREQGRVLLTRDRSLLRRNLVEHGHLVRAGQPYEQLAEVVQLYGLHGRLAPFSRCMACNGRLQPVDKTTVLHRLQPLTRQYYDSFRICRSCDRVYWPGTHRERMEQVLRAITSPAAASGR